jgi:hypothetical protein
MKLTLSILTGLLLAPLAALHAADLKLPSIFSDHMVLQCAKALPVWGWAEAGERIEVEFAGQTKSTTADAEGKWTVKLDALEASAVSREMIVRSLTQNRSVKIAECDRGRGVGGWRAVEHGVRHEGDHERGGGDRGFGESDVAAVSCAEESCREDPSGRCAGLLDSGATGHHGGFHRGGLLLRQKHPA